jgi:hypothetical protein
MVAFFVRSLELLMNVLIVLGVATVFVAAGAAGFGGISIENGQTWGGPIPFLVVLLGGLIYRIRPVCLPCLRDGVGDSVHQ